MTYLDKARDALTVELHGLHPKLLDLYALLVHVKGEEVTCEDVHNAWATWQRPVNSSHPNMVPFEELAEWDKEKDQVYVDAIKAVAEKLAADVPRETEEASD